MNEMPDGYQVCPMCGYIDGTVPDKSFYLTPGTVLHGRYVAGKVIGCGGNYITYIGMDNSNNQNIVIKEYFLQGTASRQPGTTSVAVESGSMQTYNAGLDLFVTNGYSYAQYSHLPCAIDVGEIFYENNTAYIIMSCLSGQTLSKLMAANGTMPYESARLIMTQVLISLEALHAEGVIHGNVCPGNVFITDDNQIKLFGMGEARAASDTSCIIIKDGYSPAEQYVKNSNIGPWTDVYAVGAVMYKLVTGRDVPDALSRVTHNNLESPAQLGADISVGASNAIMNALNVRANARPQSADEFARQLANPDTPRMPDKSASVLSSIPLWLKIALPCVIALMIIVISVVAFVIGDDDYEFVPDVTGGNYTADTAQTELENLGFEVIIDEIASDTQDKGKVLQQSISGAEYKKGTVIILTVSKGKIEGVNTAKMHTMPDLVGVNYDDAVAQLEGSIKMYAERIDQLDKTSGIVLKQCYKAESGGAGAEIPAGEQVTEGTTVVLVVSTNIINVPLVTGKTESDAKAMVGSAGGNVSVSYEYNDKIQKSRVISQSVEGQSTYGTTVKLVVSLGKKVDNKCTHCGSTEHATGEHPTCKLCGSAKHTETEHPKCSTCGSTAHTTHPVEKCAVCGTTSHTTAGHPKCPTCGATDHTVHPATQTTAAPVISCAYCGSNTHTSANHPKCATCGSTAHTVHPQQKCPTCGSTAHTVHPKETPKCPTCGSTAHTTHPVEKCAYCGLSEHITGNHKCKYCGDNHKDGECIPCHYCRLNSHTTNLHPRCLYCSSVSHISENHPKCSYCGKTAHTTAEHPQPTVVPDLTGVFVGTSYHTAWNIIKNNYPEVQNLTVEFHMTDGGMSKGQVVYTEPKAGETVKGELHVYIQQ